MQFRWFSTLFDNVKIDFSLIIFYISTTRYSTKVRFLQINKCLCKPNIKKVKRFELFTFSPQIVYLYTHKTVFVEGSTNQQLAPQNTQMNPK